MSKIVWSVGCVCACVDGNVVAATVHAWRHFFRQLGYYFVECIMKKRMFKQKPQFDSGKILRSSIHVLNLQNVCISKEQTAKPKGHKHRHRRACCYISNNEKSCYLFLLNLNVDWRWVACKIKLTKQFVIERLLIQYWLYLRMSEHFIFWVCMCGLCVVNNDWNMLMKWQNDKRKNRRTFHKLSKNVAMSSKRKMKSTNKQTIYLFWNE